jgi:hypothetical protein
MEQKGSLLCSKEPTNVPIMNQINPVHITPSYFSEISFHVVLPPTSNYCDSTAVLYSIKNYGKTINVELVRVWKKILMHEIRMSYRPNASLELYRSINLLGFM